MAEKCESIINSLNVKVDVDCSEALKGLKAVTRAAKKVTAALRELEEQQSKLSKSNDISLTLDGRKITQIMTEEINRVNRVRGSM